MMIGIRTRPRLHSPPHRCWCTYARASEEAVDRATQTALHLDTHPDRGALQFERNCAHCRGSQAEGDAGRCIPALAGQHFAYLVRKLANFAGMERGRRCRITRKPATAVGWHWVESRLRGPGAVHKVMHGDGVVD